MCERTKRNLEARVDRVKLRLPWSDVWSAIRVPLFEFKNLKLSCGNFQSCHVHAFWRAILMKLSCCILRDNSIVIPRADSFTRPDSSARNTGTCVCSVKYKATNRHRHLCIGRCVSSWWPQVWFRYWAQIVLLYAINSYMPSLWERYSL